MSFQSHPRRQNLEISVQASHPQLLAGLDDWVQRGLISDATVRRLCQDHLTCRLPTPQPDAADVPIPVVAQPETRITTSIGPPDRDLPAPIPSSVSSQAADRAPQVEPPPPGAIARFLQSLMAELSVLWLLGLGVFLVVVSSAVLAASQWQQFTPTGQYAILWFYTLVFFGAAFWTARQPNLRSTAWMLQLVTLLLVAINTWAMDALRLWASPWGWLLAVIASLSLIAIVQLLTCRSPGESTSPPRPSLPAINYLALSGLHWGWAIAGWPLVAVYAGFSLTLLLTIVRPPRPSPVVSSSSEPPPLTLGAALVIYGLLVLWVRAVFVQGMAADQIGLAIGGSGWLLAWLAQRARCWADADRPRSSLVNTSDDVNSQPTTLTLLIAQVQLWERVGGTLLILGWLTTIVTNPGQALAVSGLILWLFHGRLGRSGRAGDALVLFLIGLQSTWLLWRLVPPSLQRTIVTGLVQWVGAETVPGVLMGMVWLPYLAVVVGYCDWLRRRDRAPAAAFGEGLALGFGGILTLISLANPIVRSLNLATSTLLLIGVLSRRRTLAQGLVYFTLCAGIATVCSLLDLRFPQMDPWQWSLALLGQMIGLWGVSLSRLGGHWRRSTWHLGLGLAGCSYLLLLGWRQAVSLGSVGTVHPGWPLIWLGVPLGLTLITRRATLAPPRVTVPLTVGTLGLLQVLTLPDFRVRLLGLGAAALLTALNATYWPTIALTTIALGFGLATGLTLLWEGWPGLPPLAAPVWLVIGSLTIALLWGSYRYLCRSTPPSADSPASLPWLYAQAADFWAIVLYGGQILGLLFQVTARYTPASLMPQWATAATGWVLIAAIVTAAAVALRCWPLGNDLGLYGIAVPLEFALAEGVWWWGGGAIDLAVANVVIGVLLMLWGRWRWRSPSPWQRVLPLVIALLGWGLRLEVMTAWTGLLTLATAIVALGVGGYAPYWRPVQVMGLIGLSVGIYEGVGYQLAQAPGGSAADGAIVLAGTAAAIVLLGQLGQRLWVRLLGLPPATFTLWANLHWGLAVLLMLLATLVSLLTPPSLKPLGLAIAAYLCLHALWQGRTATFAAAADRWIYAGLGQGLLLLGFARINWEQLSIFDNWLGFVACGLGLVWYSLPWSRWDWRSQPWQRAAIVLPLVTALMTTLDWLHPGNALVAAGYYAGLAYRSRRFRLTYISVFLADWAVWRWLARQAIADPLLGTLPLALTLLYIAQFDPGLRHRKQRDNRHLLRLVGLGLIQGVMLFSDRHTGIAVGGVSLLSLLGGLGLKIRAPLYVGTVIFLANIFNQLIILNQIYPLTKWIVGLMVGSVLIWIAATFETRRLQLRSLLQSWSEILNQWE